MKTTKAYLLIAAFGLAGFGPCDAPDVAPLLVAGFSMLNPPSNLFVPGAIVIEQTDASGKAQLKMCCGPRAALGANYHPRVSETMSSTLKMSKMQQVSLEAEAIERFKSKTSVQEVESVTVAFRNPKILMLSDEEVASSVCNRTPACQHAIDVRTENGFMPTYVSSSYIADVEYTVHFKNEATLSKSVKERRMGQIAANLGGGHTEITQSSLRAVNLVIAVRTDPFLMKFLPDGGTQAPIADPGNHAKFLDAVNEPDAPLVLPAGGYPSPIIGG